MKKLIVAVLVVAACHSAPPNTSARPNSSGSQTGAADATSAITGFLAAAKQQDLQGMSVLWGSKDGPARDHMERKELEQREFITACYLKHDRYDIIGDAPNPGGARAEAINISLGDLTRSTVFVVVQGPQQRWYVQSVDVKNLTDLCAHRSA